MLNLVTLQGNVLARYLKRKLDGLNIPVNGLTDQGSINAGKMVAQELLGDVFPGGFEVRVFPKPLVDGLPGHAGFYGYSTNRALKADFPSGLKHQKLLICGGPFCRIL
jgi:hypothetical protein